MGKFLRRALGTLALFGTTFGGRMNAQEASEKNKQAISTNFAVAQQERTGNGGIKKKLSRNNQKEIEYYEKINEEYINNQKDYILSCAEKLCKKVGWLKHRDTITRGEKMNRLVRLFKGSSRRETRNFN